MIDFITEGMGDLLLMAIKLLMVLWRRVYLHAKGASLSYNAVHVTAAVRTFDLNPSIMQAKTSSRELILQFERATVTEANAKRKHKRSLYT